MFNQKAMSSLLFGRHEVAMHRLGELPALLLHPVEVLNHEVALLRDLPNHAARNVSAQIEGSYVTAAPQWVFQRNEGRVLCMCTKAYAEVQSSTSASSQASSCLCGCALC